MINLGVKTVKLMEDYYIPNEDKESLNRAEIIFRDISSILKIKAEDKVLDVGFGGGYLLKKFLKVVEADNLYGVDISDKYINLIDFLPSDHLFSGDAQNNLDMFADNCFDIIISTDVIEHVFDPVNFYHNLLKKTKDGGYIILNIPMELNLHNRLNILFGINIHKPFTVGGHIRFFKSENFVFLTLRTQISSKLTTISGLVIQTV